MFLKSLNILALVVLFVTVHQSQTQLTTTTSTERPTTEESTTTGTITTEAVTTTDEPTSEGPTTTAEGSTTTGAPSNSSCQALTNCSLSDPPICGRLPTAICRRFRNICDLQDANCAAQNNPLNTWTIVQMPSCSDLAVGGTGLCSTGAPESRPGPECPPRPLVCPTGGNKVCAISRNGQQCRMLVNECALRNLNCQTEPRNNWLATSRSRCRNMCPGKEPEMCTTNRFRILVTVDDEDNAGA